MVMETLGCTNFDWLFRQTALSDFTLVIRPTSSRSDDALPEQSLQAATKDCRG